MNGACKQKIKIDHHNFELGTNVLCRFYFRFARFHATFNFCCADFDLLSLSYGVCRLRDREQLKTLSSLLHLTTCISACGSVNHSRAKFKFDTFKKQDDV